jgi:negative regulator of sigma-B (phosphoserine phosphatase)
MIEWARVGHPLPGEQTSGDLGVVLPYKGGILVGVIDGLGHGKDACLASQRAEQTLAKNPSDPLDQLVERCHEALRETRGAVMSLASFSRHGSMTWLGVGNVEALLVHAGSDQTEAIPSRGGTVGYLLPKLTVTTLTVRHGDTLVLATDGIRHGFKQEVRATRSPQEIAEQIVEHWARETDDCCAIVARYVGETTWG